jgi:Tfp pilus assembly protein PilE
MFRRNVNSRPARSALTLVELVVVLAILAALAGIVIPLMPGLVAKSNSTAGMTNLDEIVKAVQLYASQHNSEFPNDYDSLVDSSGALQSYVPNGFGSWFSQGTSGTGGSGTGSSSTLSADLAALSLVGIDHVVPMSTQPTGTIGDWSPTYFPYGTDATVIPTPVALGGSGGGLAYVNGSVAAGLFAVPSDGRYVIFGLGKFSTISGVTMAQPPVYFSATNGYDPDHRYARFGLVFQTAGAGGTALIQAKFLGAVAIDYYGLQNQDQQMYQNQMVNH